MDTNKLLSTLGFTQLESAVYCELLRSAPATGYRLANGLRKAPANIYQTLKALVQKGAIVALEGAGAAAYLPVPPRQLLAAIRADFEERHGAALSALEAIHIAAPDETVYQLRTVNQVYERVRAMLSTVREVLVFDMVPQLYDSLRREIDAVRERGVLVVGIAYRPEDARPTMPYNGERPTEVTDRWPGLGLILIVDGREQLIAQISRDLEHVLNAVYSDSVFLSSVLHSAVTSDIRLVALKTNADDPLQGISLKQSAPPGLRDINRSAYKLDAAYRPG